MTLDDELMREAARLTGISERTELIREGLQALIRIESTRRLVALGGSDPDAVASPRRRGRGLSPADVRLLGSVLLSPGVRLWTRDKRLHAAAGVVGVPLFDEQ